MRTQSLLRSAFVLGLVLGGGCADSSTPGIEDWLVDLDIGLGDEKQIDAATLAGTYEAKNLAAAAPRNTLLLADTSRDAIAVDHDPDLFVAFRLEGAFQLSTRNLTQPATLHADCVSTTCPVFFVASSDASDAGNAPSVTASDLVLTPGANDVTELQLDVQLSNGDHVALHASLPHDASGALLAVTH